MSETLTDFLLARIAEDEDRARSSDSREWTADLSGQHLVSTGSEGGVGIERDADPTSRPRPTPYWLEEGWRTTRVVSCSHEHRVRGQWGCSVPHIARHDPARVLAECEAKRRIVELHGDIDPDGTLYGGPCGICAECGGNDNEVELPCPTLRFLALPCADHPDYREEWRP